MFSAHLARNLVALRERKAISQAALAKLAGIPRSTLTQIESGAGNPSLHNLVRLSGALQVGIEELLSRPRNAVALTREKDVLTLLRAQGRVKVRKLIPDKVKGLEVDYVEIAPGLTMAGHPHLAGAKEYLSVLQGEVTVHVAGEAFAVKKGDVLAFPGDQMHSYRNDRRSAALALSIVVPVILE